MALDKKPKFPEGHPGLSSRAGTFPCCPAPHLSQNSSWLSSHPLLKAPPNSSPGPWQPIQISQEINSWWKEGLYFLLRGKLFLLTAAQWHTPSVYFS